MSLRSAEPFIIDYIVRAMHTFRSPLIVFFGCISWITFSVLNRPVGTENDTISSFVWWTNLSFSIINSILIGFVLLKIVYKLA